MSEREILNTRQAAEFLQVAKTTLEHQRAAGNGPPFARIGKRLIRYRRAALESWLVTQEQVNGKREQ